MCQEKHGQGDEITKPHQPHLVDYDTTIRAGAGQSIRYRSETLLDAEHPHSERLYLHTFALSSKMHLPQYVFAAAQGDQSRHDRLDNKIKRRLAQVATEVSFARSINAQVFEREGLDKLGRKALDVMKVVPLLGNVLLARHLQRQSRIRTLLNAAEDPLAKDQVPLHGVSGGEQTVSGSIELPRSLRKGDTVYLVSYVAGRDQGIDKRLHDVAFSAPIKVV